MKAVEWIDRVKKARGLQSDYAAAAAIGMNRSQVSKYRSLATPTLDETSCLKVASVLGCLPESVLLDQMAERVANVKARTALLGIARRAFRQ
jgi:hypothetical protein